MFARWYFKVADSDAPMEWQWQERGEPPVGSLLPVRRPKASNRNRHIPVTAFSVTNRGHMLLETGLEHDLLRRVDRDPQVIRVVAQPCQLKWKDEPVAGHTPDLLTLQKDGSVTVWDVRPEEEQDSDFQCAAAATRQACAMVGWDYEVFSGLGPTERLNLLWLNGFRHQRPWNEQFKGQIRQAARIETTLGELFDLDDGSGELISTVWHLIWLGDLQVDITELLETWTPVEVCDVRP
jgi:hypothetical protein